jgi:hypothetical protein
MCDRRIHALVNEIRDLYELQCQYASRLQAMAQADDRKLIERCTVRDNPRFPELRHFGTVFDCQDAVRQAWEQPVLRRRRKVMQVVIWCTAVAICLTVQTYTSSIIALLLVVGVFGVAVALSQHHAWFRGPLQRSLREQLLTRGVPICVECGYDLRGQTTPRCPECGSPCDAAILGMTERK